MYACIRITVTHYTTHTLVKNKKERGENEKIIKNHNFNKSTMCVCVCAMMGDDGLSCTGMCVSVYQLSLSISLD